jgi:hypothetical protein
MVKNLASADKQPETPALAARLSSAGGVRGKCGDLNLQKLAPGYRFLWVGPAPSQRTRRKDHALLIVHDKFGPAIPRSGWSPVWGHMIHGQNAEGTQRHNEALRCSGSVSRLRILLMFQLRCSGVMRSMKRRLHNRQYTLASDLGHGLASPTHAPTTKGFALFPAGSRDDGKRILLN